MTDILIKSFNRPYYLDRCLRSIERMVAGQTTVTVLDDGTPQKYLDKIRSIHPDIEIKKSADYPRKTRAVEDNLQTGKPINGFQIPTDLWISAARNASPYFIMTEDDCWFTQQINIDTLVEQCEANSVHLLKLGWLGNTADDRFQKIEELTAQINRCIPQKLILKGESFMNAFFYNKYKFYSLLYKLGIVDNTTQQRYWTLNSILMGLYDKNYWLAIWRNMSGIVDEKKQLVNAAVFYRKDKNNLNFTSRLKDEAMKTTFQSSATGSYHEYGNVFDVNLFNHVLNEAWLSGTFDPMENYPQDFSEEYIKKFISAKPELKGWHHWAEDFRNQYRKLGCEI